MTDNEIIKAYMNCIGVHQATDCQECPYHHEEDGCYEKMTDDILSLINRQKAEIDGLQQLVNLSIDTQNEMNGTIIEQKAEIERLQAEVDKQYEIAEANVRAEIASGGTSCHWCEDKVRAEAIIEFVKMAKGYSLGSDRECECRMKGKFVFVSDIERIAKEMVGDTNG